MIHFYVRAIGVCVVAAGASLVVATPPVAAAGCLTITCDDELPVTQDAALQAQLDLEPPPTTVPVTSAYAPAVSATVIPTTTASAEAMSTQSVAAVPAGYYASDYKVRSEVRSLAYPETATVHVLVYFQNTTTITGGCSGFLIGRHTVGLAGHCVFDRDHGYGWAKRIDIIPGQYLGTSNTYTGGRRPYGTCYGSTFFTVRGWKDRGKETYDYGAVNIGSCSVGSRDVGDRAGYYGFYTSSNASIGGLAVNLSGYPDGYPLAKYRDQMWKATGAPIYNVAEHQFSHKTQTAGGDSGAALWRSLTACGGPCVYGVHLGVYDTSYPVEARARRITDGMFNNWKNWRTK